MAIGFSGHAHMYERNIKPNANSLVTYITGDGGATLEPIGPCSATDAYGLGWSSSGGSRCGGAPVPTSKAQVFHFLKVTVNGSNVTVAPTDSLGRTFDVMTYNVGSGGGGDTQAPRAPTGLTASATSPTRVNLSWTAATDRFPLTGYDVFRLLPCRVGALAG